MDSLKRMEAERACERLVNAYANRIDVVDKSNATGVCYAIARRVSHARGKAPAIFEPPQFLVGYRDAFVRDPRRSWLFARREIAAALQRGPD